MILALYALRALVALLASRRLPALRPLAQARLAVLLAAELYYLAEPRLVAALSVALPGLVLAPVLVALRQARERRVDRGAVDGEALADEEALDRPGVATHSGDSGADAGLPDHARGVLGVEGDRRSDEAKRTERGERREHAPHPAPRPTLAQAVVLAYLAAGALAAAVYAPGRAWWPPALLAARLVAAGLLAARLARRWPRTWAEAAPCVAPAWQAAGLAVGVWALAWPPGLWWTGHGLDAVRARWWLAQAETVAAGCVEVAVVAVAWVRARRAG